jgi:hypothetical protein
MLSTGPAQILPQILILQEQVVDEQWPSELEWSEDYNKLMERARQAHASGGTPGTEMPEYAFRGVAYGAAGWSMSSLAVRDALLHDYTEALKASPDTPPAVKKELTGLFTNPAFKYPAGQDQK